MSLIVGTNTWVTMAEADTYFSERIGSSKYWVSGADKEQSLITAYRQINNMDGYVFPVVATDNMKYAQCEQALFLLAFSDEIFRRSSLKAQGVTEAGIVKEKYMQIDGVPIAEMAKVLLKDNEDASNTGNYAITLERDEDEEVSSNT